MTEQKRPVDDLTVATIACKRVLIKLQTLSDQKAAAVRTDGRLEHGTSTAGLRTRDRQNMPVHSTRYADSRIPDGVDNHAVGKGDHAPSKQLSLFYHYRWRMDKAQQAEDAGLLLRLAGEATRDYEEHTGQRRPLRFEDGPDENGTYQTAHSLAVKHLLRHFVGVSAESAAIEMRTPSESFRNALEWVRQQRLRNGYDAESGEPAVTNERARRVVAMAQSGIKQRVIAEELGVSPSTVSRILAGKQS